MVNPASIGKRRSIVQIQSKSTIPDAFGQPQEIWTTVCTLQGKIRAASQREVYQAGALTSQVTHVIEAWWLAIAIAAGMRAVSGTHIYKIQAVVNIEERNKELRILCLELNGAE